MGFPGWRRGERNRPSDSLHKPASLASFHKLIREGEVAAMKTDARLRAEEKRKWKITYKSAMDFHKRTRGG